MICFIYDILIVNKEFKGVSATPARSNKQNLKLGQVTPLFKKGDCQQLENYQPITLLPIIGKLFEKIIYSRLYTYLASKNILNMNQFGFRKSHSTSHAKLLTQ